jgi:NitT/TauT family transport system substrate-binding protein
MRRIPHLLVTAIAGTALALAAGCAGSGGPAGLERVSYLTGAGVQGRESYIYVAMARGFFREAGLEVEVRPGNGTLQNLQVLQSGQADFAVVDITAALIEYGRSGSKFRDFTVVSAIQQRNLACIMALDGSGITRAADLAGKRIAYIPGGVV